DCSCSKGSVEDKVLVPKPPKNCARCAKCGHPVNGLYCQGCALLREKLEEDLVTYLKYFQDTPESSDDNTNVVNAPREPFVLKQDHGVKSSQNPPQIDKCFCECDKALDCQPPKYTVNHPIFNAHNDFLNSQNELFIAQNTIMEQMTQLTSMCELVCQNFQKKQEEKRIEEEQAASARYWKIPACCDDDEDYDSAITPVSSTEGKLSKYGGRAS
nr:hypothetical protein [Tanacetum cinerariifolium]